MNKTEKQINFYNYDFLHCFPLSQDLTAVSPTFYTPTLRYTLEEENWIQSQLQNGTTKHVVRSAARSVE